MASRTKKIASDTVTFKKSELIKKLEAFLVDNNACDGDWLNKVKVEFLGLKTGHYAITVKMKASCVLEIASDGMPSKEEVTELIRGLQSDGDIAFDVDEEDFEFVRIEKA